MAKTALKDEDHSKAIVRLIKEAAYSRDIPRVFNDFLEMSAISISNQVDCTHREEREKHYLELINGYDKPHQQLFPQMFAHLVEALEEKAQTTGPEDVLGPIFHELELHQKYKGQFFTPQHISDMMAMCVCGDDTQRAIVEKGYISMCEPTCGSGVMVMSMCKAMTAEKLNYCSQLVVTAIDIDLKCTHMTYLQLALYGVPAVVIHGNSLTMQEWSRWYTPVYILNGWIWRCRCAMTTAPCAEDEMIKCALEPTYAALRLTERLIGDTEKPSGEPEISPESAAVAVMEAESPADTEQQPLPDGFDVLKVADTLRAPKKRPRQRESVDSGQLSLFEIAEQTS